MYKVIKKRLYYYKQGDLIEDHKLSAALIPKLVSQGYIEKVEQKVQVKVEEPKEVKSEHKVRTSKSFKKRK